MSRFLWSEWKGLSSLRRPFQLKRLLLLLLALGLGSVYFVLCFSSCGDGGISGKGGIVLLPQGDYQGGEQGDGSGGANSKEDKRGHFLPGCIIIGVRKCGTRALIDMLNLHPQVEKSANEIHFFDRDENYIKGLEWYASQMPESQIGQIGIEKSPSYFVTPEVPERIFEMNSSIKLLLIVREPVTRVISDYTQIYQALTSPTNNNNNNNTTTSQQPQQQQQPSLEELVLSPSGQVNTNYKAVRISMYSRYMRRWLDVFPKDQILVIDGDALIRDPYNVLREVEAFLGLEHRLERDNFYFNNTKGFYCWRGGNKIIHCLNDSKGRRHPVVKVGLIRTLREFYRKVNYEFYDMVGRDFGWPEK